MPFIFYESLAPRVLDALLFMLVSISCTLPSSGGVPTHTSNRPSLESSAASASIVNRTEGINKSPNNSSNSPLN